MADMKETTMTLTTDRMMSHGGKTSWLDVYDGDKRIGVISDRDPFNQPTLPMGVTTYNYFTPTQLLGEAYTLEEALAMLEATIPT